MNLRKFKLSCKYFGGFTCIVDLDNHDCISTVINDAIQQLRKILKQYQLEALLSKLEGTDYHVHGYTFADTLIHTERVFYICSHCEMLNVSI